MKLSRETQQILKNFASINSNLTVKAGNVLQTVAVTKSVMATAQADETFPNFAIYDLSEFLGVLSLFEDPDLEFGNDSVTVSQGRNRVKYMFGDTSTFKIVPPEKPIVMPKPEVSFELDWNDIQSLIKASSVLKLGEIAVSNEGGETVIKVFDVKNPLTNNFSVALDNAVTKGTFTFIFKVENLRLLQSEKYSIKMSSKKIANWVNVDSTVEYFVAMESQSSFEA